MLRQPIVVIMGHVDHGKTSLLDRIRKTSVQKKEAGQITQHIGASEVPASVLKGICGSMLKNIGVELALPGLLFIDTPGHEAFTNLRRRGGSISDIAVLVVDISQGFQPQTIESLEILKEYKTPFIIAANKLDLIAGWHARKTECFAESSSTQQHRALSELDEKIYGLVGKMHALGFSAERFDRVSDFTKQIAIVPVSAKSGEGIAELLMFISGLSQKYLEKRLKTKVGGAGRGSIIEVKEEKGLGTTADIVLYDGSIKKSDIIVFGTSRGPRSTKIRALLRPKPLGETREGKEDFSYVDDAHAACGLRLFAPDLEGALPGSPIAVARNDKEKLKAEIRSEISTVLIEDSGSGIILKADTLGSLEAITKLLSASKIPIRSAGIGAVSKKDVARAAVSRADNVYHGIILAFNVPVNKDAEKESSDAKIAVIKSNIIYSLFEEYEKWCEQMKKDELTRALDTLVFPAELKILPNCCFRASKPAIFGVEVLGGRLRAGCTLVNSDGKEIGKLKGMQREKESVTEAKAGTQLAISVDGAIFGRSIKEGDILYTSVPKSDAKLLLEKYKEFLSADELALLEKTAKFRGEVFF